MSYTTQCKVCGGWLDGHRSDMACDCPPKLTEAEVRRIASEEVERATRKPK